MKKDRKIAVLGLGYVGLPLAVGLSSSFKIIGFDISLDRVSQLMKGIDVTLEVKKERLKGALKRNLTLTNNYLDLKVVLIVVFKSFFDRFNKTNAYANR